MLPTKIYVTTMYKSGDRNSNSYVVFASDSEQEAVKAGEIEMKNRSGKYDFEVVELLSGVARVLKVIKTNLK